MIAVGGENLIDLVAQKQAGNDPLHYRAAAGGGPFNVAMAVGRQGHKIAYLSPISKDSFGDLLADRLVESHVTIAAERVDQPTSLAVVTIDSDGIPSYSFHRNGTAERQVTAAMLARIFPENTKIFHVGGLALIDGDDAEVWKQEFARCRMDKILTSLDPNVRPALINDRKQYIDRIGHLMRNADIIKLSDDDLTWLYPDRPLDVALAECRAQCNAALFILTLGSDGARGFVEAGDIHIAAAKTQTIIDTVGAGDTFMASILCWIVETGRMTPDDLRATDVASLESALTKAAKAAAFNCEHSGCNPPWRYQTEL